MVFLPEYALVGPKNAVRGNPYFSLSSLEARCLPAFWNL